MATVESVKNPMSLLQNGVAFVKTKLPTEVAFTNLPLQLVHQDFELKPMNLQPGINPTFFLKKDGVITHAVINGFLVDLSKPLDEQNTGNGLIYRK